MGTERSVVTSEENGPAAPATSAPRRRPLVGGGPGSGPGVYRTSRTWAMLSKFSLANLIAALVVAGILAAVTGIVVMKGTPNYESVAVIELHQPKIFTDPGPGPITKLNALRARYASLAQTQTVLTPVAQAVGIGPGAAGRAVTVVVSGSSLLMKPTAQTSNPELSQRLADARADQLSAYAAKEQSDDKIATADQVQLGVVRRAQRGVKVSPEQSRALTAAAVAFVI